jgi:lysophospholipase L1-like esterase
MKLSLLSLFSLLGTASLVTLPAAPADSSKAPTTLEDSIQNEPGLETSDPTAPVAAKPAINLYPPDPVRYEKDKAYRAAVRNQTLGPIVDIPGLPRVLIIGDSISVGYTLAARARLEGKANVHRADRNAGGTRFARKFLKKWLGDGKWDVIHFNFGLHDLVKDKKTGLAVSPEEYERSLREIVAQLKATGAKVIWATTTPKPPTPNYPEDPVPGLNRIAAKVMAENGVAIDDLYAVVKPRLAEFQRPDDAHYTLEGYEFLGTAVAASIESQLPKAKASP